MAALAIKDAAHLGVLFGYSDAEQKLLRNLGDQVSEGSFSRLPLSPRAITVGPGIFFGKGDDGVGNIFLGGGLNPFQTR